MLLYIIYQPKDIKEHQDYLSKLPATIDCTRRTLSLRHVLHINESDPKTLQLRLPKKAERPRDAVLQSGYTSMYLNFKANENSPHKQAC